MLYEKSKKINRIKNISVILLKIVVGTMIMAIGIDLFLVPSKLSTGGFSGIGTVLYYLWNIPVGTTTIILNIPLFAIAFFKLGKKFTLKTIIGTASLSYFLNVFEKIKPITNDKVLAFIYGSIAVGIGTAIVLKARASTGGSDLLASIIRAYKRNVKTGSIIIVLDTIVVGINVIFFRDIEIALYSGLAIYIMGKILDIFFEGIDFAKMFLIISSKGELISDRISKELARGTTKIKGIGMYKKESRKILLCVVSRSEVRHVMDIIEEIDKTAFTIITNAREVYGKGFK